MPTRYLYRTGLNSPFSYGLYLAVPRFQADSVQYANKKNTKIIIPLHHSPVTHMRMYVYIITNIIGSKTCPCETFASILNVQRLLYYN